ncbi:MAG: hypothetical protein IT377_34505 [Polyangiaceae bacterium]|nr:hypothetical protein [Polyangiaceae bacterium]
MTGDTRRVVVQLFESETIVGRGRRKVTYLVRVNDAWVAASVHPGAVIERLSAAPGTVWEHRLELLLPVGSRLCRVESTPLAEPARDALAYLTDERRSPRRATRRRELVVDRRGDLVDAPARR